MTLLFCVSVVAFIMGYSVAWSISQPQIQSWKEECWIRNQTLQDMERNRTHLAEAIEYAYLQKENLQGQDPRGHA